MNIELFARLHVLRASWGVSYYYRISQTHSARGFFAKPLNVKLPASKYTIMHDGLPYEIVREGLAEILNLQQAPEGHQSQSQAVFYNPVQQFNRDLSVLAIRVFGEDLAVVRASDSEKRVKLGFPKGSKGLKRKRDHSHGSENSVADGHDAPSAGSIEAKLPASLDADGIAVENDQVNPISFDDFKASNAVAKTGELSAPTEMQCDADDNVHEVRSVPSNPTDSLVSPTEGFIDTPKHDPEWQSTEPSNKVSQKKDHRLAQASPFRILDALSATGLRALRYAKEIPMSTSITANDLSPQATASIMLNIKHNNVNKKVHAITGDARSHMYSVAKPTKRKVSVLYEVIDLDPYGTAVPFLDAAVNAVVDGGLLCVTCTDAGVFASVGYHEKTYSQYGGLPLKGPQSHEAGIRLILHAIATCAARYGRSIEPLLSLSIDFYVRAFVRVRSSPAEVKFLASKTMTVYNCDEGCGAWSTQYHGQIRSKLSRNGNPTQKFALPKATSASQSCPHCHFATRLAGPMWGGPLYNPHFIERILELLPSLDKETYATLPRIEGMLTTALSETLFDQPPFPTPSSRPVPPIDPSIRVNHPFFINLSTLAKVLHCVAPSDAAFRGALMHLGYKVSRSHTKPGSISTNAPWGVIWEVMREWVRQKAPIQEGALKPDTAGHKIMQNDRSRLSAKSPIEMLQPQSSLSALKDHLLAILDTSTDIASAKHSLNTYLSEQLSPSTATTTTTTTTTPPTPTPEAPDPEHPPSIPTHSLTITFDETLGRDQPGKRLVRYQMNPRPDWGPMHRARGG